MKATSLMKKVTSLRNGYMTHSLATSFSALATSLSSPLSPHVNEPLVIKQAWSIIPKLAEGSEICQSGKESNVKVNQNEDYLKFVIQ